MRDSQKTIIWDFDGTLAERPGLWSGTMANVLEERFPGSGITREDIRPHMKNVFPWDTPDIPHLKLSEPRAWWARMEQAMAAAYEAAGVGKDKSKHLAYLAHLSYIDASGFILYDDTVSTLERLSSSGWKHIILSNHVPELESIVGALGIAGFFSSVISSAITGYEKPNPESFRIAMAACGNPDVIWMIGDSPTADIRGANNAGIPAVLVHTPNECGAEYHANALKNVIPIIETD